MTSLLVMGAHPAQGAVSFDVESLDGSRNNLARPAQGQAGTAYSRVAAARYADGRGQPVAGPNSRQVSNRIFNDVHQNIFSEHRVTQWSWTWGQFLDHTFGLAAGGTEAANIPFNANDPLETFSNTLGVIPFTRDLSAPGTGVTNPRQQVNTVSSYIDAWAVYGGTPQRLEWMRDGPYDNNMANNAATLMLPGSYLPRRTARGNPAAAPAMNVDGRLAANPNNAAVAGDVRANENVALTATHTLFAREHNRIVSMLPSSLSAEDRFQIARRIVIAEQQYITYNEFLPAMGVSLPRYTGYNANVDTTLSNEFAVVGYRAHSQIHGEFTAETQASRYTAAQLAAFRAQGLDVQVDGADVAIGIPLNVAFFNPDLLPAIGLGPFLTSLSESQYNNDEMIDNQLRSVLFQVPVSANPTCLDGPTLPACFTGVLDLGAIDIERGRDHGMPSYNQLRQAYGLAPKTSFTAITGEATDAFPAGSGADNPNSLDFLRTADINGTATVVGAADGSTSGVRRSTTAARLRAVYGNVNNVDAFTGMIAERHVPGSEFGELQRAIWTRQFLALRDGDRFFYGNDMGLTTIAAQYGIDFHTTLAQVISRNTDTPAADINPNVFLVSDDDLPAATCRVDYRVVTTWPGFFQVDISLTNQSGVAFNGWNLQWQFANGQTFSQGWNGTFSQNGVTASIANASWNGVLAAGATLTGVGFNGTWDNVTGALPVNFTVNGKRCALG
ncbi:peroxidase family protein [Dactylosporangium sp. NPDC000555]|uniref:peroxidase family protein n=1 Tax=Dactylosporangium sp. NPDC000555 TaxID=3154260 RepID=UPI0033316AA9